MYVDDYTGGAENDVEEQGEDEDDNYEDATRIITIIKPASFSKRAPATNSVVHICCDSVLACRNSRIFN